MAQEHLMIFLHSFINVERQIFIYFFFFFSDEGPMLETLDHTIRIGSTPTFLYFDLYLINLPALPPSKTVLLSVQPNYVLPVYTTCFSGHMWFQNN